MSRTKKKESKFIRGFKSIGSHIIALGTIAVSILPIKSAATALYLGTDIATAGSLSGGLVGICTACGAIATMFNSNPKFKGKLSKIQPYAQIAMRIIDVLGNNYGKAKNDPKLNK